MIDVDTGQERLKLTSENMDALDAFGFSVDIHDNLAIVGAPGDAQRGDDAGATYVFDFASGQQIAKLTSETGQAGDYMGWSADAQDGRAYIGIPGGAYGDVKSGVAQIYDVTIPPALQAGDACTRTLDLCARSSRGNWYACPPHALMSARPDVLPQHIVRRRLRGRAGEGGGAGAKSNTQAIRFSSASYITQTGCDGYYPKKAT